METENKTKHLSTDPRLNVIPESPQEYYPHLYNLMPPDGFNHDAEAFKKAFADEIFPLRLPAGQADNMFRERQIKIFETHKTSYAKGKAVANEGNYVSAIEADNMLEQIRNNPKHAYNDDTATPEMRQRAIFYVETLLRIKNGETGWSEARLESEYRRMKVEGFPTFDKLSESRTSQMAVNDVENRSSSNGINADQSWKMPKTNSDSIGHGEKKLSSASGGRIQDSK